MTYRSKKTYDAARQLWENIMTTLYWTLLFFGYIGLAVDIMLCIHFAKRCNWLGFPRVQTDQTDDDPTNPATIRRDIPKWLTLAACSLLIIVLTSVYGDWETPIDRQHVTPALVIVGFHSFVTIFTLAILATAHFIHGKHPLLE